MTALKRRVLAGALSCLAAIALAAAAWAAQGSLHVPTTGPLSPTVFAGDVNTVVDALISKNSGGSSPTNYPTTGNGATQGQDWWDTSPGGGIIDERVNDGAGVFVNRGAIDATNHLPLPKVGGGSGSLSGASGTPNLGSARQAYVLLTGTVPGTPVTSFGNSALLNIGESKFVRAAAAGIITYNATSMILPGSADLPFNAGDTFQLTYLGGGNWLLFDYQRFSGLGLPTGALFSMYGTGGVPGAVRAAGRTIGDASSGATELADPTTVNLWIRLYLQDGNLTVSGGRTAPGNTRAAAITDYNLHKTIVLPDLRSRVEIGLADMGNGDAHRMGGALFASGNPTTLGAAGGESAHINGLTEETPHNHPYFGPTSASASSSSAGGLGVPNAVNTTTSKSGGKSVTVTSASPAVVTWTAHGFAADQPVQLDADTGGALPTGISAGTTYYVLGTGLTANTFQIATSPGGAAVNTSSTGTSVIAWSAANNLPPFILVSKYLAL